MCAVDAKNNVIFDGKIFFFRKKKHYYCTDCFTTTTTIQCVL